jgi:hypothetical protein
MNPSGYLQLRPLCCEETVDPNQLPETIEWGIKVNFNPWAEENREACGLPLEPGEDDPTEICFIAAPAGFYGQGNQCELFNDDPYFLTFGPDVEVRFEQFLVTLAEPDRQVGLATPFVDVTVTQDADGIWLFDYVLDVSAAIQAGAPSAEYLLQICEPFVIDYCTGGGCIKPECNWIEIYRQPECRVVTDCQPPEAPDCYPNQPFCLPAERGDVVSAWVSLPERYWQPGQYQVDLCQACDVVAQNIGTLYVLEDGSDWIQYELPENIGFGEYYLCIERDSFEPFPVEGNCNEETDLLNPAFNGGGFEQFGLSPQELLTGLRYADPSNPTNYQVSSSVSRSGDNSLQVTLRNSQDFGRIDGIRLNANETYYFELWMRQNISYDVPGQVSLELSTNPVLQPGITQTVLETAELNTDANPGLIGVWQRILTRVETDDGGVPGGPGTFPSTPFSPIENMGELIIRCQGPLDGGVPGELYFDDFRITHCPPPCKNVFPFSDSGRIDNPYSALAGVQVDSSEVDITYVDFSNSLAGNWSPLAQKGGALKITPKSNLQISSGSLVLSWPNIPLSTSNPHEIRVTVGADLGIQEKNVAVQIAGQPTSSSREATYNFEVFSPGAQEAPVQFFAESAAVTLRKYFDAGPPDVNVRLQFLANFNGQLLGELVFSALYIYEVQVCELPAEHAIEYPNPERLCSNCIRIQDDCYTSEFRLDINGSGHQLGLDLDKLQQVVPDLFYEFRLPFAPHDPEYEVNREAFRQTGGQMTKYYAGVGKTINWEADYMPPHLVEFLVLALEADKVEIKFKPWNDFIEFVNEEDVDIEEEVSRPRLGGLRRSTGTLTQAKFWKENKFC